IEVAAAAKVVAMVAGKGGVVVWLVMVDGDGRTTVMAVVGWPESGKCNAKNGRIGGGSVCGGQGYNERNPRTTINKNGTSRRS
nr:hypothetical protein [Tanacetum cinerariifolium]